MVSSNHLDPGIIGRIQTKVDTSGRSGQVVKHVTIYSNDRTNPVTSLTLIMTVVPK